MICQVGVYTNAEGLLHFFLNFNFFVCLLQTETIFVRACESRMDLLRAVIIGAEGTPYHDGLFFFDIQFPDSYPSAPPVCYQHILLFLLLFLES